MLAVIMTAATPVGCHHTWLGVDLKFGIEFEGSPRHNTLTLHQSATDQIECTRTLTQHDFTALENALLVGRPPR